MMTSRDVLEFWLHEVGPDGWYKADDELDETIRARFEPLWREARAGHLEKWKTAPQSALAYLIVTDQFPRNMFRGEARAFATDRQALTVAKEAIVKSFDLRVPEPERQFFYLPLMHSENLCDQERCVRLMCERMPETGAANLLHARAHREVIRRFGRFPYRNAALARQTTPGEAAYEAQGGYGATVRELQAAG